MVDPGAHIVQSEIRGRDAAATGAVTMSELPGPSARPARSHRGVAPEVAEAWAIVQYARCSDRPSSTFYFGSSFEGFLELHGDRRYREDPSIRGGIAWLGRQPVMVVGHERGSTPLERERCNFGMPFPEGLHKARRLMRLAERFRLPVVTLVDTPGAFPGLAAEERGQAGAIAALLECMAGLEVPTVSVVIGQGGSGGALALALADRVLMFEFAVYSVISPEGCASILWHDEGRSPEAARALGLTAHELYALGLVDEVIPEPPDGIVQRPAVAAAALRSVVKRHLDALRPFSVADLVDRRMRKAANRGVFADVDARKTFSVDGGHSQPQREEAWSSTTSPAL